MVERALDDARGRRSICNAVVVGDRLAASSTDFIDDTLRGASVLAFASGRGPDVVDHHASAFGCQRKRNVAPDSSTGAGDDDDLACNHSSHIHCSDLVSVRRRMPVTRLRRHL